MSSNKNETYIFIKPVYSRNVSIDENIHAHLSLHALSLYMAFRFEATYGQDNSELKRSAKFLYTKAKISRAQYYRCLNELEEAGLILRDPDNSLGEKCVFHVARDLHYFNNSNNQHIVGGVSHRDRGVSDRDTDQYSFQDSIINNTTNSSSTKKSNLLLQELIEIYRQEFPNNPQPHKTLISTSLEKTLRGLVKRWPEADPDKKPLTPDSFRRYMQALKSLAPRFSLGEYTTQHGTTKKNSLETFARWNTFVKFMENQYS